MDFAAFRKAVISPALQAVADHWDEARGKAPMPSWEQLKPSRIAAHLPILWFYKYDREAGQFIGRLAGDRIIQGIEKNFRGMQLEDMWSRDTAEMSRRTMTRVICEPAIYRNNGALFRHAGRIVDGERIMLPLGSDGHRGDGLLGASAHQYSFRGIAQASVELISDAEEWVSLAPALTA